MTAAPHVASADAIRHHNHRGNEFFALWLDPTMSYSCALWDGDPTADLETAQVRKIDYHLTQAGIGAGKRLLDIGCGWGAVVHRAVGHFAAREAVGLTLSQAQGEWIAERKPATVQVRVESWTDHTPPSPYDGIVSVGAFEHFAQLDSTAAAREATYRAFFDRCREWLPPGGRLSLQTFAYASEQVRSRNRQSAGTRFLATEIFPETDPPVLTDVVRAAEDALELVAVRNDRLDYARTCRAWLARLDARREPAVEMVGEETVARYRKYLELSALGFAVGQLHLYRLTFQRPTARRLA